MKELIEFLEKNRFQEEAINLKEDPTILSIKNKYVDIGILKFLLNILTIDTKISPTLTCLVLEDAFIQSNGLKLIAEFLECDNNLISLDLSNNYSLHPQDIEPIGKALEFNNTLKYLTLRNNKIGLIGAKAIAEGLKLNKSLIYLDLRCESPWGVDWAIGDKGAGVYCRSIEN